MDGISFRFLNGTFFEMPTLVLNRLSLEDFRPRLRLCWKGNCSQIQVSLAELQKGECVNSIIPSPILDGKLDELI